MEQPTDPVPVDEVVARVRADLDRRRRDGELPHLPAGELDRQFSAVIEAVDAGLVEDPPIDPEDLAALAVLETWRPPRAGLAGRVTGPVVHVLSRLVGALVRRQVEGFSRRVAHLVETLIHRQNRLQAFVARTHLERLRALEHRVAELEREVDQLRDRRSAPEA